MKLTCYSRRHKNLILGMRAYHQTVTHVIGEARHSEILLPERPLHMLERSADLLLKLGEEIRTVTSHRQEAKLIKKIRNILHDGRTLLDALDCAVEENQIQDTDEVFEEDAAVELFA